MDFYLKSHHDEFIITLTAFAFIHAVNFCLAVEEITPYSCKNSKRPWHTCFYHIYL